MVAAGYATRVPSDAIGKEFDDPRICNIARLLRARHWFARRRPACVALAYQALSAVTFCIWHPVVALARRGPSHLCKRCNQGHRWHRSVVSVQAAHLERRAGLLIIRRSWVEAPPAPHTLTCGNVRFGPAGQHAYRMDAGMVAAMTRPSVSQSAASAARSPGWPSSNRSGPARSRGTPPRPALGLTQRPGERQSCLLCVTTSRAGPELAQGIISPNGVAFPPPPADLPRMVPPWPACQK